MLPSCVSKLVSYDRGIPFSPPLYMVYALPDYFSLKSRAYTYIVTITHDVEFWLKMFTSLALYPDKRAERTSHILIRTTAGIR
jgi:hypothetical protein